jgi:predicted acetylornithine/succinylornithine family transaminase
MTNAEAVAMTAKHVMTTYRRAPVAFARGEGVWLVDLDGKRYLDFIGGIAVSALGHAHPRLVRAISEQAGRVLHVSNLFHVAEQAQLAKWLTERSAFDRVFFCNSGAEAIEAALKLARRWGRRDDGERYEVIVADQSFHGRTMGALAATMQPKYQAPFGPLPLGFVAVPFNNMDAIPAATTARTVAVMLEPIQGESGITAATPEYLKSVREWCDARGMLMILDEIQTGMGRTGRLFAYEHYGIEPDVMTLAKGLGGGVPIGALLTKESVAALVPGDHGTTFGGNPLACAAGLAVARAMDEDRLPEHAASMGAHFKQGLQALVSKRLATAVRGMGLLLALELTVDAAPVVDACRDQGLLINAVQQRALRFAPPLIVSAGEIDQALSILERVLVASTASTPSPAPA